MFKIEGQQSKPTNDVTFSTYIDDDGDLVLLANGTKILFIDHHNGQVVPFYTETACEVAGLSYRDGHINIQEN